MKLKYFNLAEKLATKSDHSQHKLGCAIVKKNKILGIGFNRLKTSPFSNHPFHSIHAEVDSILDCNRQDLEGAELYIFRRNRLGELALSFPCKYCQDLLKSVGIKMVHYTDNNTYKSKELI